jgi:glycosyltransferase involved in cell wall biosynthesis
MILAGHCRRAGVRHLHAQFADAATDVALLVANYGGGGWTWSLAVHGPVEFYNVEALRLREKIARATFVQAISDFGRSQLMTLAPEDEWSKLHVVHCGIEPDVYRPEPAAERADGDLRIICVGRLVHLKGQSVLVEAVAELKRRGVGCRVVFVGDGPSGERLAAQAAALGTGAHVELLGSVGQHEIRRHYLEADVFCLPSFAEGVPVVLMEAMALERPVVTTQIMGIPELVEHGVSGLLVPPGRVDRLADALQELATDSARRAEMGAAGRRKVVAEFDVNRSAERLREIFGAL